MGAHEKGAGALVFRSFREVSSSAGSGLLLCGPLRDAGALTALPRSLARFNGQEKHKEDHFINFYLVAEGGEEVLAATGEDHGNAHYLYLSTPALKMYGEFNSNNRRDLITW
jgi:hypothetical protein